MALPSCSPSRPAFSWHPKITPYRLAFIGITGGLGIAKAVLVSKGQTASSTTLEWITGVVVALSFQFLGVYEYRPNSSVYISWIFSYDCLKNTETFVHGEPNAGQDNLNQAYTPHEALNAPHSPPLVTAYRLLVSTIISLIGLTKTVCAYLGFSTAMNTLDWIMAVPLTLGLYYLGTFEDQQTNRPRRLFDVGYSREAGYALIIVFRLICIALCIYWLVYWTMILIHTYYHQPATSPRDAGFPGEPHWHTYIWETVNNIIILISMAMIQVGVVPLFVVVLWPMRKWLSRWRHAGLFRYIGVSGLFISLYITCVLLYLYSYMLFVWIPNSNVLEGMQLDELIVDPDLALHLLKPMKFLMSCWPVVVVVLLWLPSWISMLV